MRLRKENIDKWLETLDRQSNYIFRRSLSYIKTKDGWLYLCAGCHVIDVMNATKIIDGNIYVVMHNNRIY